MPDHSVSNPIQPEQLAVAVGYIIDPPPHHQERVSDPVVNLIVRQPPGTVRGHRPNVTFVQRLEPLSRRHCAVRLDGIRSSSHTHHVPTSHQLLRDSFDDFRRLHRSGLIACVYRASEWRHKAVETAAHDLLERLDEASGIA
jgi:hypothetical protein